MTLPDYTQGTGFYDPGKTYPGYLQPQYPTMNITQPWAMNEYLYRNYATNDDPQSEYNRRLTEMGLGGTGSRAQAAQKMYGQFQSGYGQARLRSNFNLYFPEYLDQTDLQRTLQSGSFAEQGLDPRKYGQGKLRWAQRGY